MQFLAPLWLALAGAAAVPLLLHLLRRQMGVRVAFPAARYLARAEQEHSARVRLRNWLLLALRVLALVLVALAAARPLVGGRAGGRAPAALAVVLDNSLSTAAVAGGRPVLDDLRARALAALGAAGARDRVWLVTADGRAAGADVAAARAAAQAARPLAGAGDLPAAVARAVALARGAGLGDGAVVVVTDGQASAWTRPVRAERVRVAVVAPDTPPPADRAVLDAAATPARWSPVGDVTGRVSAEGAWRVLLADSAGREAAAARGTADAGGQVRVTLRPGARGWLAGAVALPPDEWRASDVRHFAVLVGDPPPAAADVSAGPFAAAAVAALAASGRVREAAGTSASVARVAEPGAAARLPALLVAPGDGARLGAANQALARLGVPWRFGALATAPARARLRRPDAPASTGAADTLGSVDVARRWRLEPAGGAAADTLAEAGGEAWAVAGDGYVLLASPLDPAWTALPVRAAFVPWLDAVLARRLAGGGSAARAAPGAPVRPPASADALVGPITPEASADPAAGAVGATTTTPIAGAGSTPAPDRPGVYFWRRVGATVGALVVDAEPAELALARLDGRTLAARVQADAGRQARAGVDGAAAARTLLDGAGRRPAAGFLALAALLALAAEALAARPRRPGGVATPAAAPRPARAA